MMVRGKPVAVVPRAESGAVAVLDGIRVSWEWLCADPHPVTVDGSDIAGLEDREIPLGELRALVLDKSTGRPVRDAVWAHLIERSRRDGATWTVACAGMALPMLAGAYRDCATRFGTDRDELASAVVAGFVAALAEVDTGRPGIASTLRWAALRAGLQAGRNTVDTATRHDRQGEDAVDAAVDAEAAGRAGHPDLVLAAAVADGVLSGAEADLIGETRLQRVPLNVYALRLGVSVGAMTMRRLRAELRLAEHLHATAARTSDQSNTPENPGPAPDRTAPPPPRNSSRAATTSVPGAPATDQAGPAVEGAGPAEQEGVRSPSVSSRRRRRTRGARRAGPGAVTR